MRAQTPASAAATPMSMVLTEKLPPEFPANHFYMHEITITSTIAVVLFILAAGSLPEISDRGEIDNNRAARVKSALEGLQSGSGVILLFKLNINISDHVIGEVIADIEVLDLTELAELLKNILVEILKVFLDLKGIERLALGFDARGDHVWTVVHVGEEESGRNGRSGVEARATVTVTASTNFEVERTIDSVLLRAEDGSQVLRHDQWKVCRWILGLCSCPSKPYRF